MSEKLLLYKYIVLVSPENYYTLLQCYNMFYFEKDRLMLGEELITLLHRCVILQYYNASNTTVSTRTYGGTD